MSPKRVGTNYYQGIIHVLVGNDDPFLWAKNKEKSEISTRLPCISHTWLRKSASTHDVPAYVDNTRQLQHIVRKGTSDPHSNLKTNF